MSARRGHMVVGFTTTYAISAYQHLTLWVPTPVHGEVYSIQHYVIKIVSELRQVSLGTQVSSTNKTNCHDTTEILLKVVLNTINQT